MTTKNKPLLNPDMGGLTSGKFWHMSEDQLQGPLVPSLEAEGDKDLHKQTVGLFGDTDATPNQ